jgi:hypothetical protein
MHFYSLLRISTLALFGVFCCQLATAQQPQWWINQKRACGLAPNLAYETWRRQGFPCPGQAPAVDYQEEQRKQELELETQKEAQRQQEAAQRKQWAAEADQQGLEAAAHGNWNAAANSFIKALGFAPDSQEIRAHLNRANTALADAGTAADILALRQRVEDAITAAGLESWRRKLEDDVTAQRLAVLNQSLRSQVKQDARVKDVRASTAPQYGGPRPLYPIFLRPISPNSPPAKVLAKNQPKIKTVDDEILLAQNALRRLIESNTQSEEERLEWTRASEEATIDAKKLSLDLLFDFVGAHINYLIGVSDLERADVLTRVVNRTDPENSIHSAYGMLVNRKEELIVLKNQVRLGHKAVELDRRREESSSGKNKKSDLENFWDLVSWFEKVDDLAGPSKDLVDATYTIYKQAVSFEHLAATRANQEKTLQAAAGLRRYILKLEAQKKSAAKTASRKTP